MAVFQSETVVVERDADGSFALTIDVPGRSVNVLTRQVLTDLDGALTALAAQPRIPLLMVKSGKKSGFLAGADLAGFLEIQDSASATALSEQGQRLFGRLADLPGPSIAAIHGPCLGGGLELALACDYRLVVDRPDTTIGFPEIELGLLPGWGGTQRLPRIIGLERALQVILAGKRLNAKEAVRWGLADVLAGNNEAQLREQTIKLMGKAIGRGKRRSRGMPLHSLRQTLLESTGVARRVLLKAAARRLRQRVPDDMPAPAEALEAVRVGMIDGMSAGLSQERQAAGRLAISNACRNLITLYFQREQARKAATSSGSPIRKVGIVGAGVMGAGIAQLAALKGCEVIIQEVNEQALAAGQARVDALLQKAVERGVIPESQSIRCKSAIQGTTRFEGFDTVDVVIEAAVEDLTLKKSLFQNLGVRTRPDTILATNTSSLRVADLQEGMPQPGRVAGLHFFNPVHKMPLVEVVRASEPGHPTDEKVIERLSRLAVDLGKTPVVVGDGPGFVVNRVLMPYLNEAVLLVGEGMGIAEVDGVMKRFGMPMGPLELLDQIGLDVAAHVARAIEPAFSGRFPPNPAFEKLRDRGYLGLKNKKGFYLHEEGEKPKVNPEVEALLKTGGGALLNLPKEARRAEARERLVLPMVNESALVLQEKLAASAEAVDLALVLGTGWAPHRGGPLRYADNRGLGDVVQALSTLATRLGPRFAPCEELKQRAETGKKFRAEVPPRG